MSQLGSTLAAFVVPGGIVVFLAWLIIRSRTLQKKSFPLPPGPPSTRLLGHDLPSKNPFLTVASWIQEYGPIISLRTGTTKYVVIGHHKAASQAAIEIMEKQGSLLAERPRWVAAGELLGGGLRMFSSSGEKLRNRALHAHLQPKAAQTYEPLQALHAKYTVLALLETAHYQDHAQTYAASVILKLAYGKNTPTHATDPDVVEVRKSGHRLHAALRPGAYLVDIFPFLKYLPWYGQDLRKGHLLDRRLFSRQMDAVKHEMNSAVAGPSFGKFLLERGKDFGLTEDEIIFLAGGIYLAGSDSTAGAICTAMLAAVRHPEAQAIVHAELDEVVGRNRVDAMETSATHGVNTVYPPGPPYTETIVFPDPEKFDLTRWLTLDGKLRDDLKFPAFGFGRRSIFIDILLVLWSFRLSLDTSKPVDDMAFMTNVMPTFQPCSIDFEPRVSKEDLKAMMEQYPNAT
ncbi:cytochrome P450 [Melanogaster broomeanus]|nr:cytochrome P450 [Melanogaster broomeanus]